VIFFRYLWNILLWVDQGINTFLGGDPRETLSSRFGKKRQESKVARIFCDTLNKIDKNHCDKNIDNSVGSKELWSAWFN